MLPLVCEPLPNPLNQTITHSPRGMLPPDEEIQEEADSKHDTRIQQGSLEREMDTSNSTHNINMLNCFKDYKRCIHISYYILDSVQQKKSKFTMRQPCMLPILHCQYHSCWYPDDFRSQGISRPGNNLTNLDVPSPASEELTCNMLNSSKIIQICICIVHNSFSTLGLPNIRLWQWPHRGFLPGRLPFSTPGPSWFYTGGQTYSQPQAWKKIIQTQNTKSIQIPGF